MKITKGKSYGLRSEWFNLEVELEEISDTKTVCKLVANMIHGAEKIYTLESREDHDFDDPVYDWLTQFKDGKDLVARVKEVPELNTAYLDFRVSVNGSDVNGLVGKFGHDVMKISVRANSEENIDKMARVIKRFVSKLKAE